MKFLKTVGWITWYTALAGAVLGGLYGLAVAGFFTVLVIEFNEGLVLGPVLGAIFGLVGGAILGLISGFSVASVVAEIDLPPDDIHIKMIKRRVIAMLLLIVVGGLVLLVMIGWIHLMEVVIIWFVPAVIAFAGALWVVNRYVDRLTSYESGSPTSSRMKTSTSHGIMYWLFGLAGYVYAMAVIPPLVINLIFGEGWTLIAFYNTFAHVIWLPAFLLLTIAFFWRRWILVTLMLVPVMAFMLVFGVRYTRYLPQSGDTIHAYEDESWYLDVMTYNIQWRNSDYTDTIRVITESGADVVALQELSRDAARIIEAELQDVYPYMALHTGRRGVEGQGLLSRYPILDSQFRQDEGTFGTQEATIQFETERYSTEVVIHNVHPHNPLTNSESFDPQNRAIGIENILARTEDDASNYRILLGDFNMPELSSDYAKIDEAWRDVYANEGKGLGLTFKVHMHNRFVEGWSFPILRLDYIFVSGYIYGRDAWLINDTGGSDHRPVMARLWLNLDPTRS